MTTELREVVEPLLRLDLQRFIARLNSTAPPPLQTADAVKYANAAERLSRSSAPDQRRLALLICALLWEHRDVMWLGLRWQFITILSRLGLGPTSTMMDSTFRENQSFAGLGSLIDELWVTALHSAYEVRVTSAGPTLLLSGFQAHLWHLLDEKKRVGVSAPTSAGKSFVLAYKLAQWASLRPIHVVYVVPTLALVRQVRSDVRSAMKRCGVKDVAIADSSRDIVRQGARSSVLVVTQERLLATGKPAEDWTFNALIVDEVQNLDRIGDTDSERARILRDVIEDLVLKHQPEFAVFSGPGIHNIGELTRYFLGSDAVSLAEDLTPVVNLTYAVRKEKKKCRVSIYVPNLDLRVSELTRLPPLEAMPESSLTEKAFAGIEYVAQACGRDEGTIIFAPKPRQATGIATALKNCRNGGRSTHDLKDLSQYIANTVHPSYPLVETLLAGVGYHHGKMPQHARLAVEYAFLDQQLRTVVATSTLMQGVNFPAKNIIIRNPRLFARRNTQNPERNRVLNDYEYANLRGRAGRLMNDLIGRAILLDEEAFEQENISLNLAGGKTVPTTYKDRFDQHRSNIMDRLDTASASVGDQNSDLIVYIRQSLKVHGLQGARERLARQGIEIDTQDLQNAWRLVELTQVPIELCREFRYWDPLALDKIYVTHLAGQLPQLPPHIFVDQFDVKLEDLLTALSTLVPKHYERALRSAERRPLWSICKDVRAWCGEETLVSLLSSQTSPIDDRIEALQKVVSFELPRLLAPVARMQQQGDGLVAALENGCYQDGTKGLVDAGIPREVALRLVLQDSALARTKPDSGSNWLRMVLAAESRLERWDRRQLHELGFSSVDYP